MRLELRLLGRGEGREVLPLKAAQQEGPANGVPTVGGVGAIRRQSHVLALTVADEHDPLGQIAPGLDGTAYDLSKMLHFANTAAYLVTTKKGAIRSMPERAQVEALL